MAVWLTSLPLDFKFLGSNPGSNFPFLIKRDRYDQEKLYAVKRFVYSTQTGENPPPAKIRTHDHHRLTFHPAELVGSARSRK